MIKKVEHIGIAVKDINSSITLFEKLLGVKSYKTEKVLSEGVNTAFFGIADQKIELLSSVNKDSAIEKFLENNFIYSGNYSFSWDGENKSTGIYFFTLHVMVNEQSPAVMSRKMIYLK